MIFISPTFIFLFGIVMKNIQGTTLIGRDDTACCIYEILHGIGYAMCAKECHLRSGYCQVFSYDHVHLTCKLLNSTSTESPNSGFVKTSINDTRKELAGKCETVTCQYNETCVALSNSTACITYDTPRDCKSIYDKGIRNDGMYVIFPFLPTLTPVPVVCDMSRGGYTMLSRRVDGTEDFYRDWENYKHGFGNLEGEFWIGNDVIHALSSLGSSSMYIELTSHAGVTKYADYSSVFVADETDKYRLTISGYSGTAGDSLSNCRSARFSTKDKDYDTWSSNCAQDRKGGWWYNSCCLSHLTSYCGSGVQDYTCNRWHTFANNKMGMKNTVMLIRRNV